MVVSGSLCLPDTTCCGLVGPGSTPERPRQYEPTARQTSQFVSTCIDPSTRGWTSGRLDRCCWMGGDPSLVDLDQLSSQAAWSPGSAWDRATTAAGCLAG